MPSQPSTIDIRTVAGKIIAESPLGITIYDEEGRCIDVNKTMLNTVGMTRQQMLELNYDQLDLWKSTEVLKKAQSAFWDKIPKRHEIRTTSSAGDKRIFDCHLLPLIVDEKTYLLMMTNDISEYFSSDKVQQIETTDHESEEESTSNDNWNYSLTEDTFKQLLNAQKLESLGVLAGGIAHDFNNMLTAVMNSVNLAKTFMIKDQQRAVEYLDSTLKAIERSTGLTKQLLSFSKGGSPVRKAASIAELISESANFVTRGSSCRCVFNFSNDLLPVEVDKQQISQVVHNLIMNSLDAMPNGGTISIRAENVFLMDNQIHDLPMGTYVKISFSDQGSGIPKDIIDKIFDPFYTTKPAGSGLGLTATYTTIRNHGGSINVQSKPGKETVFTFYLPTVDTEIYTTTLQSRYPGSATGRVLLMDDEQSLRETTSILLEEEGYIVSSASDGTEAIVMYKQAIQSGQPFDVVILDLTVPGGMGGSETFEKLRQVDPDVKAIICSGYSTEPVMANYRSQGFKGVLIKPFSIISLVNELQIVLKE